MTDDGGAGDDPLDRDAVVPPAQAGEDRILDHVVRGEVDDACV